MKPRKSWEPEYRFGGNPAETWFLPALLGTRNPYVARIKTKPKPKRSKK